MDNKRLNVSLDEIVEAMDCHLDGTIEWFLDTETGAVLPINDDDWDDDDDEDEDEDEHNGAAPADDPKLRPWQREAKAQAAQVRSDGERFVSIPQNESFESYRVMKDFIERVKDPRLRDRLADAIAGKGAFRRFKDVLFGYPEVRQQWFEFDNAVKRRWAAGWLGSIGIESTWHPPRPPGAGGR